MSLWFRNEYDDLALGPVFGVNDDCDSVDESQPPSTAEEFLRRCMREARSYNYCAGNDGEFSARFNNFSKDFDFIDPQREELRRLWSVPPNPTHVERQVASVPEDCIPTKEWELSQVGDLIVGNSKYSHSETIAFF